MLAIEAVVELVSVGAAEGAASPIIARVVVKVRPDWLVARN
jgi:hypothetical protein